MANSAMKAGSSPTIVTFENLDTNSDIGRAAAQVPKGDHLHVNEPYLTESPDVAFSAGTLTLDGNKGNVFFFDQAGGAVTTLAVTLTQANNEAWEASLYIVGDTTNNVFNPGTTWFHDVAESYPNPATMDNDAIYHYVLTIRKDHTGTTQKTIGLAQGDLTNA